MSDNYDIIRTPLSVRINKNIVKKLRDRVKTGLPAKVTDNSNYEKTQTISVELLIEDILDEKDNLQISNVVLDDKFVRLHHGNGFHIKLPVAIGDMVLVKWGHKSLENYFESSGNVKVGQSHHLVPDLDDCWIELGFGTPSNNSSPSKTNLVIEGDNTVITITPSGDITTTTKGNITCVAEGSYDITASHLTVHNSVTIKENLTVDGNTDIGENLSIGGTTTSTGAVTANGGVFASSYSGIGGGGMSVSGGMAITGTVTINGINITP